jgi:hypothetical protein
MTSSMLSTTELPAHYSTDGDAGRREVVVAIDASEWQGLLGTRQTGVNGRDRVQAPRSSELSRVCPRDEASSARLHDDMLRPG